MKENGKRTDSPRRGRPEGSRSVGWRVRQVAGRQGWVGLVRVPGQNRYISRSWDKKSEAEAWAEDERARLLLRVKLATRQGVSTATAGLAADYLADLARRRRSPATIRRVGDILRSAAAAVPDLASPAAAGQARKWLEGMSGLAARTHNKALIELRALAGWAVAQRRIPEQPFAGIEPARVEHRLKPVWSVPELRQMLMRWEYGPGEARERGRPDPWHLVAALAIYTGMRVGEILRLDWSEIDWPARCILVTEAGGRIKTRRERIVPLQDELAAILENYRQGSGPMVSVGQGNPRRLLAFVARAGVEVQGRSPHSFRHAFAGLMTATGVPGPLLAAWMGHESVQTTMGYTGLATRYLAAVEGWGRGEMAVMRGVGCPLTGEIISP